MTARYILSLFTCLIFTSCTGQDKTSLVNVATTTRVSAMHYSQMVCDKEDNVYIASYIKDTLSRRGDFIYIVKLTPQGEKVWERGIGYYGRAISITIDKKDRIWVGGYFEDSIRFGKELATRKGVGSYLASFNTNGECTLLTICGWGYTLNNLHYSKLLNTILETGTLYANISRDEMNSKYTKVNCYGEGTSENNFLVIRNLGMKSTGGSSEIVDAEFYDIIADNQGNFYLTGNFSDSLIYPNSAAEDNIKLRTENYRDNDGFILKVDAGLNIKWIKQFGKKGEISEHYTSHDAGCSLAVNDNDELIVPVAEDSTYQSRLLYLDKYAPDGTLLLRKRIAKNINAVGAVSIAYGKGKYYLTYLSKDYCETTNGREEFPGKFRIYILTLNEQLELLDKEYADCDESNMIRESIVCDNYIYFSGAFRQELTLGGKTIKGTDKYSLFLYSKRLD